MQKYTIDAEAIQFTQENKAKVADLPGVSICSAGRNYGDAPEGTILWATLDLGDEEIHVVPGDWFVIVHGRVSVYTDTTFRSLFAPVPAAG